MSNKDPKMSDTRDEIEESGKMKEQCSVFVHEFSRNLDAVYELGLGDVTFFGLNEQE